MKHHLIGKKNIILLLIFFMMICTNAEEWEIVSEMPMPVKGGQAVVKDSLVYILGGYTDLTYEETNIVQVYNPRQNTWSVAVDTLKNPRYGHIALNYRHEMVIFGGVSENDSSLKMWNFTDPFYQYDFNANFNRKFATAQVNGNDLYLFGGYQPGYSQDDSTAFLPYIAEYHIPTSEFTFTDEGGYSNSQNPVQQISVLSGDNIFVMGGALNGIREDIYRFNMPGRSWGKMSNSLQDERAAGAAVLTIENRFAVIGGYNENTDALASVEEFEIFNEVPFSLGMLSELNTARSELTAVYFDTSIYVFGGQDILGNCLASVERLIIDPATTDIRPNVSSGPSGFQLYQNYPNPFNPKTVISYQLSAVSDVDLSIYNILGQKTAVLVFEQQSAGEYKIEWDAKNYSSGVYFCVLKTGMGIKMSKMILMR